MTSSEKTTGERRAEAFDEFEELRARNALLSERLAQLRAEYTRARRSQYRRTALGFLLVGLFALAGGGVFPAAQTVLFALGGTGIFIGLLTYYLTPERFLAADVGAGVYTALASTGDALTAELGLTDERTYVPTSAPADPVRLYVPQRQTDELPDDEALRSLFVVPENDRRRGISLMPTGGALFTEFERVLVGELAETPSDLAEQLVDGLVEGFELVDAATWDLQAGDSQLSFGISGSAYGSVQRFDHPVASFLAVGVARGLDKPVTIETVAVDDGRADVVVSCRWKEQ